MNPAALLLFAVIAALMLSGLTGCESTAARENREAAQLLKFLTTPAAE